MGEESESVTVSLNVNLSDPTAPPTPAAHKEAMQKALALQEQLKQQLLKSEGELVVAQADDKDPEEQRRLQHRHKARLEKELSDVQGELASAQALAEEAQAELRNLKKAREASVAQERITSLHVSTLQAALQEEQQRNKQTLTSQLELDSMQREITDALKADLSRVESELTKERQRAEQVEHAKGALEKRLREVEQDLQTRGKVSEPTKKPSLTEDLKGFTWPSPATRMEEWSGAFEPCAEPLAGDDMQSLRAHDEAEAQKEKEAPALSPPLDRKVTLVCADEAPKAAGLAAAKAALPVVAENDKRAGTWEVSASKLFVRLDRRSTGYVDSSQVLQLWPCLSRSVDSGNADALVAELRHRGAPICQAEWTSLLTALQGIVGPRYLRRNLRAAEVALAELQIRAAAAEASPKRSSPKRSLRAFQAALMASDVQSQLQEEAPKQLPSPCAAGPPSLAQRSLGRASEKLEELQKQLPSSLHGYPAKPTDKASPLVLEGPKPPAGQQPRAPQAPQAPRLRGAVMEVPVDWCFSGPRPALAKTEPPKVATSQSCPALPALLPPPQAASQAPQERSAASPLAGTLPRLVAGPPQLRAASSSTFHGPAPVRDSAWRVPR
mmetsp:Transcript_56542/g.124182  ORF Transcript_56542/g.124182 Transcript_56542/m.124182 type:complete len:612 (-) Transcript_56542:72-1907(-)